ncbi:hypothetical protein BH10CYA1_BH10CYA1_52060 [soil metagenome]
MLSIKWHNLVVKLQPLVIVLLLIGSTSAQSFAKTTQDTHMSNKEKSEAIEDFPLTKLKLEKKPVSRWVFGYEPLKFQSVLNNPELYLSDLEKELTTREQDTGVKIEDNKRFADTLQYFIQQLLAHDQTKEALKLEHRLARIQAKHPEFLPKQ